MSPNLYKTLEDVFKISNRLIVKNIRMTFKGCTRAFTIYQPVLILTEKDHKVKKTCH